MSDAVHLANTNSPGFRAANRHAHTMKKRVRIGLAILVAALVAGFGWQLLHQKEPSYQGRYLSDWLEEVWYLDGGVDPEAEKAVRQIGTNAIPYLLKLAITRDSALKAKVTAILPEKWFVSYATRSAHNHFSAAFGFDALGSAAEPAVPTLIGLLDDKDDDIRKTATRSLGSIGPEAQNAIPGLIRHLSDPNQDVRVCSAEALNNIPPKSVEEVPALLQVLNSPPTELFIADPGD
ncbi:HEAT domain containing protein [Pedosphaera parvula Ellin514]|uniref:HEAT domain containing protein n=2 Tax=Pedosphaera TaxID=1032526 RepID=B9XQG4_PEDPL|nr:HEAT domain containing protein [Pedosphaera parvula Ellin514]